MVTSAPGKVDILGEHTQYADGYILSLALDRRVAVAVSPRDDNSLRFYSGNLDERKKTTVTGLKYRREDRWANYPKGVIASLIRLGYDLRGINMTILGDVPMGIGLASSSALGIASAVALKTLYGYELSDAQVIDSARLAESRFMNLDSGISSPLASYYAREGTALFLDTRSLHVEYFDFPSPPAKMLITDSRVSESLTAGEKAEFRESCRDCLDVLTASRMGTAFRDLTRDDLSGSIEGLPERSRRVCMHIVEENRRVLETRRALAEGDLDDVGKLMIRSHESLRDLLEISCPELDWLVKRAVETPGVYGSRMVGDGYGGCTLTLLDGNVIEDYKEHTEEYDRIFGFKAAVFPVEPGSGIQIHLPDLTRV